MPCDETSGVTSRDEDAFARSVTTAPPDLSIVIPALNEQGRLPHTLEAIRRYASSRSRSYEIILVDDGSTDETRPLSLSIAREWPQLRIVTHSRNLGKGGAVRTGIAVSRGRIVAFTDADLAVPIEELDTLISFLAHSDVAIASRAIPGSRLLRRESRVREICGRLYARFACALLLGGVPDAHCGLKAYRGEFARSVFESVLENGMLFDIESLVLVTRRGGKIYQHPVPWTHDPASRMRIGLATVPAVILGVARIKLRHRLLLRLVAIAGPSHALCHNLHVAQPHGNVEGGQGAPVDPDPGPVVRRSFEQS